MKTILLIGILALSACDSATPPVAYENTVTVVDDNECPRADGEPCK